MSKYVIDLEVLKSDPSGNPTLWKAKEFSTLVFDKYGKQKLTPLSSEVCIEELQETGWMQNHDKEIYVHGRIDGTNDIASNIADARQAGYEDGYNDGLKALQFTDGTELYTEGMNDAWAVALKVVLPEKAGGKYTSAELREIFGVEFDYQCFQKYTPQEVIRMLDDLESQQAIKIGDEVKLSHNSPDMEPLVVTALMPNSDKDLLCITVRGKYIAVPSKQVVKTGRHFDQVSKLLEAMKENNG